MHQLGLFEPAPTLPEGLRYRSDVVSAADEAALVAGFADLPFGAFEFQGYRGNRRVVSYGWRYDFNSGELQQADDMPKLLQPLRAGAADFAGLDASELRQVLLTEYRPGAGIGWHRDRPVFRDVVGISWSRLAHSDSAAGTAMAGSAHRCSWHPGPPIFSQARRATTGSTASRRSSRFATR